MRAAGLLALPLIGGAIAGLLVGPGIGLAVMVGGGLATLACLVVLSPGRGRDIASGGGVTDATVGWSEFHRELSRARRFDRPFALVRLAIQEQRTPDEIAALRDAIAGAARRTDRVWIDGDDLLILLPESAPETSARFVARTVTERTSVVIAPSIAVFPEDGITSGALIAAAYGDAIVPTPIAAVRPEPRPTTSPAAEVAEVAEVASHSG